LLNGISDGARQRFTIAHELGHLVLNIVNNNVDDEKLCNRFASTLSMLKEAVINKFKVINATANQLLEISFIRLEKTKLSIYDVLNYIIARDNNCILATGDNKLKIYSGKNGIEVIRTLKIIELMTNSNIITHSEAIEACQLLKSHPKTQIPVCAVDDFIEKLEKDSVLV